MLYLDPDSTVIRTWHKTKDVYWHVTITNRDNVNFLDYVVNKQQNQTHHLVYKKQSEAEHLELSRWSSTWGGTKQNW